MHLERLQKWFRGHAKTVVEAWLPLWTSNVRENVRRGYVTEARALHRLTGMFPSAPSCVLAGPGPSLDLAIAWMKGKPQNVVACYSSLNPLFGNGIHPVLTVACDPQDTVGEKISEVAHLVNNTDILVCSVTVHPSVIENWPGQVALYVTHDPSPEYAVVDIIVNNTLAPLGLSKESLGSITAGGCVGCAALEAAFYAGFRDIRVIGYEFGALPAAKYYGQRFDFAEYPPAPIATPGPRDTPQWRAHNKSQNDRYRMAFEQRLDWMKEQDPSFTWSNLSPYSFIQGHREEMPRVEASPDLIAIT